MLTSEHSSTIDKHSQAALQLLREERREELQELLQDLHPVELVGVVNSFEESYRKDVLQLISGLDQLAEVVSYASSQLRQEILSLIDEARISAIIRRIEIDDAADVLGLLPRRKQLSIIRRQSPKLAKELSGLLEYDRETAGGIMTTLYAAIPEGLNAEQALAKIRSSLHSTEIDPETDLSYIYVTNDNEELTGVCSLRALLSVDAQTAVLDLMEDDPIVAHPEDDQEFVARIIKDYDLSAIPVVATETHKLIGIVTVDDVLDVIEEEYTEDLLKLVGTEDEDVIGAKIRTSVRARLPWLIVSWVGGTGGALLLSSYSNILEQLVLLAFFMPVVFGMGGNVGSQASTITVRGIATGEFSSRRLLLRLRKEALIGVSLGIIFGILLCGASLLLFEEPRLSVIVGVSIMTTMTTAALLGATLPLFFDSIGIDPAIASGPLVTTMTDILSITIYFSVASALLSLS